MAKKSMSVNVKKEIDSVAKQREYQPEDAIRCRSIVSGGLYIVGPRSNLLYTFADYGDEVDIEYRDILYMIRSNDKAIYEPRIIILDNEIVNQYSKISELYTAMYSIEDLKEIINLSPTQMAKVIEQLPSGAIESLRGLVSTMIDNHSLDSVVKIKTLDKLLGTNLLLTLAQN